MWRVGRSAALVALLAALFVAYPVTQARGSATFEMIGKINDLRRSHGLRTLRMSSSLTHSAEAYADTMMDRQYFGHANRIQASARYRRLGEILEIHRGSQPGTGTAYRDWLHSPEHLGIILDPSFTYVGGGYTAGRFQGRSDTIWVMHFGRL